MGSVKTLDTSNLTIAASGSSVVIPSGGDIRCTLGVTGPSFRRSVKVHLINDSARPLRVIPGVRSGVEAHLLSGLALTCAPHGEISFEYHVPIFLLRFRRAFALVLTEGEKFGFLGPEIDEEMLPLLAGGLVVAAAAGAALVLPKRAQPEPASARAFNETPDDSPLALDETDEIEEVDGFDEPDDVAAPNESAEKLEDEPLKEEEIHEACPPHEEALAPPAIPERPAAVVAPVVQTSVAAPVAPASKEEDIDKPALPHEGALAPPAIPERPAAVVAPVAPASPLSRQFAAINFGDEAVVGGIECVDQRPMNLVFVAKVANQADEHLMCSIVGETRHGKQILFPDYFWVQPQSAAAVAVNMPARYPWKLDRLVLHMQNSALSCTAEAVVPVPLMVRALHVAAAIVFVLMLAGMTLSTYTRPRIQAFAAPQTVAAGSTARVSYATNGWGTTGYFVSNDGGTVQRGQLPMGRHEIRIRTQKRPQVYRVLLTVDGFGGGTSVEQEIRTLPPQRMPRAEERTSIAALEVNPPIATAGAPLQVRYVLSGGNASPLGTVSILDSVGFPLASGPMTSRGVTSLVAPNVAAPTTFRVALDVSQNGTRSQAATGLLVMPRDDNEKNTVAQDDLTPDQLFRISPRYPHSSELLVVRPLRYPGAMNITLQDDRGKPVGSQDIASADGTARFLLPVVASEQKMTVVASYVLNRAEHVAIKSIVVYPALQASVESRPVMKGRSATTIRSHK